MSEWPSVKQIAAKRTQKGIYSSLLCLITDQLLIDYFTSY
jgi:hypothetical protein